MQLRLVAGTIDCVEPIWRALEPVARPSYFLTWGWMGTWLASLPAPPQLAVLYEGATPVAACLLAKRLIRRHRVLPVRARFLNVSGDERLDELTLEHNGLLSAGPEPMAALIEQLPRDWDELVLRCIDRSKLDGVPPSVEVAIDREISAPFVDLARVRERGYLPLLSSDTRAQIRRARRGAGEIAIEVAGDLTSAFDIYNELVALHGARWRARGGAGAFADPYCDRFHRALIGSRFAHGEIQLIRVTGDGRTIGCLYNLAAYGQIAFYQSGFAETGDARIKPGFVCHAAAIEWAAANGFATYDFLGGDVRYKRSLATGATPLVWARLVRSRIQISLERWLRRRQ